MTKLAIVVCGTGSAAHVLAGLMASRENTESRVLALDEEEVEKWSNSLKENELTLSINEGEEKPTVIKSKPRVVTKDASRAVKGTNFIILTVSPSEQQAYLEAIAPHIAADVTIVGFPGHAGFEFLCHDVLKNKAKKCAIVNLRDMPYACRIKEFGKDVNVLGINEVLRGSIIMGKSKPPYDPLEELQRLLGKFPIMERFNNFIEPLLAPKAIMNPAIVYGKWKEWDGKPVDSKPLFYQGITEKDAKCLSLLSDECVETAKAISDKKPKVDLPWVISLFEALREEFFFNIGEVEDLLSLMKTNSAYDRITHQMIPKDEGFEPDFESRYLVEDVPMGIVVTKGFALLAGVRTPIHDEVIGWCQDKMGKEYLVGKELKGKDIGETRCPQRFGFNKLDDIVDIL